MQHNERESRPGAAVPAGSRRRVWAQALSIALSTVPFALAFGVSASQAGLALWQCSAFSVAVFAGSAQFAAVEVLASGGGPLAAIAAGLLLNLRSLAFGAAVLDVLPLRRWRRAAAAHLIVDESVAVATGQSGPAARRLGFYAAGGGIFVLWNVATVAGFTVVSTSDGLVSGLGIDGAVPAAFLALLWPRLTDRAQLPVCLLGAAIALGLTPLAPAGIPVIAAAGAVLIDAELRHPAIGGHPGDRPGGRPPRPGEASC